ncbi:MAG TPA: DinB family protein [Vicinamibacterales bacterium]|nr:DinB family protein [Vicinamibacterales bacterium]
MAKPEVWQRGPVEGVPALLQPVAHTLLQCREDVQATLAGLAPAEIWRAQTGASIGFHVVHALGALDRLFTYARGEALSEEQRRAIAQESHPDTAASATDLLARCDAGIDRALEQVRGTDASTLTDERFVGRARLPSTVLGLLFHAAEHMQRHMGQALTTRKLLIGR